MKILVNEKGEVLGSFWSKEGLKRKEEIEECFQYEAPELLKPQNKEE